jgi:hypothetical protein
MTASHEMCEMLVDPSGDKQATSDSPMPGLERVSFLVEVYDPSEAADFAHSVNGIQVQFRGVSNMMICDCSCQTFKIDTKVDLVGRKHVRCIECADCGKQTAVSLRSSRVRPAVVGFQGRA